MPSAGPSRVPRTAGIVLARLLPAALALAIPFLVPSLRREGPYVGASWLREDAEAWAGRTLWVQTFAPPDRPPTAVGEVLPLGGLTSRMKRLSDVQVFLQVRVDASARNLTVLSVEPGGPLAGPHFLFQVVLGLALLAGLAFVFRPAPGATLEMRSWIR